MEANPQGSEAWFAERLGKATASKIADIVAKTKTGWGATRANYMAYLVAERLTGRQGDSYTNAAMQWGTEHEGEARAAYGEAHGAFVELCGFVPHPTIAMSGASPDGLVDDDGLVEIKCPSTATHIETLLDCSVDRKYVLQMQWQMACTGRQWCDFASFDPRMPEELRLFVKRFPRDNSLIADLEREIAAFLAELDQKVGALRSLYRLKDAA